MSISMTSLLVHEDSLSREARDAIVDARESAPPERDAKLESAARLLHSETGLECRDVRELLDLPDGACA
jgi:hypothetical protein